MPHTEGNESELAAVANKVVSWGNRHPWLARLSNVAVVLLLLLMIFYVTCVGYVENYEFGMAFNGATGEVTKLSRTGYQVNPPWVRINTIDLRPMQVCINANRRVLNCKLVEFDPKGLDTFLSWHGFNYASGTGSTAPNGGGSVGSTLDEILKSYAYDGSGKDYPFLHIVRELKPTDATVVQ